MTSEYIFHPKTCQIIGNSAQKSNYFGYYHRTSDTDRSYVANPTSIQKFVNFVGNFEMWTELWGTLYMQWNIFIIILKLPGENIVIGRAKKITLWFTMQSEIFTVTVLVFIVKF